jgi:hypothetical protein
MSELKGRGFSDAQIGRLTGHTMMAVRARRKALGVLPSYKRVDTCAAEFDVSFKYSIKGGRGTPGHCGGDGSNPVSQGRFMLRAAHKSQKMPERCTTAVAAL